MEDATRIYNELRHETASIWYISDSYGSKVMIKVPSPSIKAIVKGCKMEFLFGRDNHKTPNYFHIGAKIYDDPINYQSVLCAQRFLFEYYSIAKIMHLEEVQIQFYNELSAFQAFGRLRFKEKDRHNIHSLLGNPKNIYSGAFDDKVSQSLDHFQFSVGLDFIPADEQPKELETLVIEGEISGLTITKNFFYNDSGSVGLSIDNSDEGSTLEDEVFITMASIFGKDICKSPRIPHKNATRELTDILAYSEYGIFLVEAKALGVINLETERTMERKVQGLQKQIGKAIKQLVGASKKITEDFAVYDQSGNEILFNKKLVPHGIILVSELLHFGDWKETVVALQKAMIEGNMIVHLFDMKEFIRFIGYSKDDKHQFDFFLMQRAENFVKSQSVFLASKFVDKSNGGEELSK